MTAPDQTEIIIEPVQQDDLEPYVSCLVTAFNDKFPLFFKDIPQETYEKVMRDLFWATRDKDNPDKPLHGGYVVKRHSAEHVTGERVVAAFNIILYDMKTEPWWPGWKALNRHISFWKALRAGYWLQALGQKKVAIDELYLDFIGVFPAYRGQGIGSAIFSFLEEVAEKKGLNTMSLYVSCKNTRAKKLYEQLGFTEKKKIKIFLSNYRLGIPFYYLMEKEL